MADENKVEPGNNNPTDTSADYLAAIKELREKSVDRSEYDKLRAENKQLLETVVNGQVPEGVKIPPQEQATTEDLRKAWLKEDQTNLEYSTNTLALRKALIAEGKPDPFLPIGNQILPTDDDVKAAERVANTLQECIDYAQGDSAVFTNELQRRLVDVKIR